MISNDEYPTDIRPQLDTVLYGERRIEIEEYTFSALKRTRGIY